MKPIKVAACQLEVKPGQPDINVKKILHQIKEAKNKKVDIVIFSEMAIPGYIIGDEWENEAFVMDAYRYNEDIIEASDGIVVIWGNVDIDKIKAGEDGRIRKFNTAFIAQNKKSIGKTHKTLMPDYREFDDTRHFYSLRKEAQDLNIHLDELIHPYELSINGELRKIGLSLCEDMWSDDYSLAPIEILLDKGAEFIVNISCSPWTWRKNNKRHRVVRERIKNHPVPFIYVNNTGTQNNGKNIFLYDGNTTIYNTDGTLYKVAKGYQEETIHATLFSDHNNVIINPELSVEKDSEELYHGIIYGIRNFFEKIGTKKVVIGVSGGIDSSVSAALHTLALGSENVFTVNMPSKFNSETTKSAAFKLAQNLKSNYTVIPIQESYEYTVDQINNVVFEKQDNSGIKLPTKLSPLNKENIQARDRGSRVLAAVASGLGAVFVCNGNKTEMSLGYATLYGDLNGALAILADLYKMEVYQLGQFINQKHGELIPNEIFELPASAELSDEQKVDEGKGDPIIYPYHDKLMRAFIEFRLDPEDIIKMYSDGNLAEILKFDPQLLNEHFPDPADFIDDLEQKWRSFKINYFKRIQSPPVIAVSKRAFGFDLRESQNPVHFTRKYLQLKQRILKKGQ